MIKESDDSWYIRKPRQKTGQDSIIPLLPIALRTEYSETLIGGLLPLPRIPMDDFSHEIDHRKDQQNVIILDSRKYDPLADLFSDIAQIMKICNWINKM